MVAANKSALAGFAAAAAAKFEAVRVRDADWLATEAERETLAEEFTEDELEELNASLLRAVKRTISSRAAVVVPLWPYELEWFALVDPALELLELDVDDALDEGRDVLEPADEDEVLALEFAPEPALALEALPCELVGVCLETADPVEVAAGSGVFW